MPASRSVAPWLRITALVVAVGLAWVASACAPDSARYTVVPTGDAATMRAAEAAPAAPTGDRQLDAFLARFASALDRRDWRGLALMLEGPAYADLHDAAVASGASAEAAAAALIADAVGLNALARPDPSPFSGLNAIRVVTLREITELPTGVTRVQGEVRLDDDRRLSLSAFVRRAPDTGSYRIILSRV